MGGRIPNSYSPQFLEKSNAGPGGENKPRSGSKYQVGVEKI